MGVSGDRRYFRSGAHRIGYHLIQLLAKNETDVEFSGAGLEQRIRQEQALDAFSDLREDIERSVYDEQFGLVETAAG